MSCWQGREAGTAPPGARRVRKLLVCLFLWLPALPASLAQVKGTVERVTFFSPALRIHKSMNIYLPPGYGGGTEYYPVVYLFRGHEREWINRDEDASRRGRNIQDVADELYAQGKIGKMILVMPGLSSEDNTIPGLGVNFVQVSAAGGKAGVGSGQFEDFLLQDAIPFVDSHYRTIPSRTQRGVDGFSLGELFGSAGAYDGTLMWLDLDDPRTPGSLDDQTWLGSSLFDPAFGRPRNVLAMLRYNPCNLMRDASPDRLALLATCQFLIHSAGNEQAGNLRRSQHMVQVLNSQGLANSFQDIRLSPNAEHNWYFADEHMRLTLPLHWQKFQNPVANMPLRLLFPEGGVRLQGQTRLLWSPGLPLAGGLTLLFVSGDDGLHWRPLAALSAADTAFLWDTAQVPDGTRYRLRVMVVADSLTGVAQSPGRFTIDNPGNGAPDLLVWGPEEGEVLSGTRTISWSAEDADGDSLLVSAQYSSDGGDHWRPLFGWQAGSGTYSWDTPHYENSPRFRLMLRCSDGTVTVADTSALFVVANPRIELGESVVRHVAGNGSGKVSVHVADPTATKDAVYRLCFHDNPTRYDVWNLMEGVQVVAGATQLDATCEGPLFDGLRLVVANVPSPEVNNDSTGWVIGETTLQHRIYLPVIDLGDEVLTAVPWPADYEIAVHDEVVAISSGLWGAKPLPMKFSVREWRTRQPVDAIYNDPDGNGTISPGDELFLLAREQGGDSKLTWAITFGGLPNAVPPAPGDLFLLKTRKPFTSRDVFEFNPAWSQTRVTRAGGLQAELSLAAYPNPFNQSVMVVCTLPEGGPFVLRVFDLAGRRVRQESAELASPGRRVIVWDGTDQDGGHLPSGVYVILVQAGRLLRSKKVVLVR